MGFISESMWEQKVSNLFSWGSQIGIQWATQLFESWILDVGAPTTYFQFWTLGFFEPQFFVNFSGDQIFARIFKLRVMWNAASVFFSLRFLPISHFWYKLCKSHGDHGPWASYGLRQMWGISGTSLLGWYFAVMACKVLQTVSSSNGFKVAQVPSWRVHESKLHIFLYLHMPVRFFWICWLEKDGRKIWTHNLVFKADAVWIWKTCKI